MHCHRTPPARATAPADLRPDAYPGPALVPVSSAVIILTFTTSIFAVISVHLFGDHDVWNFGARGRSTLRPRRAWHGFEWSTGSYAIYRLGLAPAANTASVDCIQTAA